MRIARYSFMVARAPLSQPADVGGLGLRVRVGVPGVPGVCVRRDKVRVEGVGVGVGVGVGEGVGRRARRMSARKWRTAMVARCAGEKVGGQ